MEEVKVTVDKLQTTISWDPDKHELITVLRVQIRGLLPSQLKQLFRFQSAGPLYFTIAQAQALMPFIGKEEEVLP